MGEGVKVVHVAQMKSMKYVQEPDPVPYKRPPVRVQWARQRITIARSSENTLVAVPPGIGFIEKSRP